MELLHFAGLPVGEELISECEIMFEGGNDSPNQCFKKCKKNKGHPNFIPVDAFGFEHLPEELRTEKIMCSIKNRCNRTVRVVVRYTSEDRPDIFNDNNSPYPFSYYKGSNRLIRYGTGIILHSSRIQTKSGRCLCPPCQKGTNPKMEYWLLCVRTATHVIFDDSEAQCSEFDCFFDTDDAEVRKLYGVCTYKEPFVPGSSCKSDICHVICVTHDRETLNLLLKEFACSIHTVFDIKDGHFYYLHPPPQEVIVSHPHACSKRITVGNSLHVTYLPDDTVNINKPIPFPPDTICRLPMKPWGSDKNSSELAQNVTQEICKESLNFEFRANSRTQMNYLQFRRLSLPYVRTMSMETNLDKDYAYNIIIAISCGFYKNTIKNGLISSYLLSVGCLDSIVSVLIYRRLYNMKISRTITPDLIDVGLLLWKVFFTVMNYMLKDLQDFLGEKCTHDTNQLMVSLFLDNIYGWRRELLPLFDLREYVIEKLHTHADRMYSDLREAEEIVVRIMTGCYVVKGRENRSGMSTCRIDDSCNHCDDDDHSDKGNPFHEILISLCRNIETTFKTFHKHQAFINRKKTLTNPDSDDFLQPGTEFQLPLQMTFTLPPDPQFISRYYKGNPEYFMFPPGTKFHFTFQNRWHEFPLPNEAEFFHLGLDHKNGNHVITYNTDTCPGSSGASVYCDILGKIFCVEQVHRSAVKTENKSGVTFSFGNLLQYELLMNHIAEKNPLKQI